MKSQFALKMLGAERVHADFDALLASADHIQLTPFGELLDECEELKHGVVDPNLAHVFSIVAAFAERPAFAIADFPSYEALKEAVVELGLLDGRRPIWWVDYMLTLEIRSLKKLDQILHCEHHFPEMRPYIEATRRAIQRLEDVKKLLASLIDSFATWPLESPAEKMVYRSRLPRSIADDD